ncbi:MmgE/PrpD family protein [Stutzerimonas azotifigens]|uniref:MmgE/PrpD family protein n=1 Tax=Stutzerimonas azotifigens TaxID=291995 RepID=UPI0004183707|nr:MmgE/PrpD family protein [Stutzerimonas azotifigens]
MATLIEQLADYSACEARSTLRSDVRHHAKRAVLDWFAALYPGTREPVAERLAKAYADQRGLGRSSLPGFGSTSTPESAAWINGTSSHAVEFDDIFRDAVYHPGVPVIAAALAVGEHVGASGEDFLRAVVVGYEISTRIGAAVQPSHYHFFHTTGTIGCFASAAAAAYLLAPGDRDVTGHALATAGSFAAGLQQAFRSDSMTKALHGGHAASAGVTAARVAANGITGALDILEGEVGFGAAMSKGPQWHKVTEGLGETYNITRITQKAHCCCGHTFAAIDAVQALRAQLSEAERERVARIEVDTYQTALDVTGNHHPVSAYQAKFSMPYVLVQALRYGSVRLEAFSEARLREAESRSMMQRVVLNAAAELTAQFPQARAARVRLVLEDGRVLEHFSPFRKGDPEAPLSDIELEDKFAELVTPVTGAESMRWLSGQIRKLEQLQLSDLNLVSLG